MCFGAHCYLTLPLYFVRGGNVYSGSLRNVGSTGDYWSQVSGSNANAYDLGFYSVDVGPSFGHLYRYGGFSLRCVAIGS